ncbi:chalcone isomerase family protein [soil metagenome]
MKILLSLSFALLLLMQVPSNAQTKVAGVTVPNTFKAGNTNLILNGAGLREKYWIDLYVGALYLQNKATNGPEIAAADKHMAVKLHIVSSKINRDNMVEAINEGFTKSTAGNTAPIKTKIDQLLAAFTSIKVGDIFDLVYEPGVGITMYKNGVTATTIPGLDFKKALFGIWLGTQAVDDNLKQGMLSAK